MHSDSTGCHSVHLCVYDPKTPVHGVHIVGFNDPAHDLTLILSSVYQQVLIWMNEPAALANCTALFSLVSGLLM